MAKTAFLFKDYIKDLPAGDIALTNEDPKYPTENSQNEEVSKATRTTDKVNILYQMDLGETKQPQVFFLGNHNLSGGSVKVYSYTDAGFSLNQVLVATFSYRALDMFARISSPPAARRYWEYDISKNGTATSPKSYFEFGRPMLYDDLVQIAAIPNYIVLRGCGYKNIVNITKFEIRHVHKVTGKRERFEFGWNERKTTVSPADDLRVLYEDVNGDAHPFVLVPDVSLAPCFYGYIEDPEMLYADILDLEHVGDVTLRFIEAVRGKA